MAVGAQPLWKLTFKINAGRGLILTFHIAGGTEAEAKVKANEISTRLRWIMPETTEIFYATLSKDNSKKDSRYLKNALGAGLHPGVGVDPPPTFPDRSSTCILVRFEHDDGGSVSRKIGPIPDEVVEDDNLVTAIASVDAPVVALPAASVGGDTWVVRFNKLIQTLMYYTQHVQSGHAPGGDYTQFSWTAAFPLRVSGKKGGRVFI